MLKRLRGTPIVRHDAEWQMVYSPHPPYEVLQTKLIDFAAMQRMRRFARYWDLFANSGNFVESLPLLWRDRSPFERFLEFSDWLFAKLGKNHAIALQNLAAGLFEFLEQGEEAARAIWADYQRCGRSDRPAFLVGVIELPVDRPAQASRHLTRQGRHVGQASRGGAAGLSSESITRRSI